MADIANLLPAHKIKVYNWQDHDKPKRFIKLFGEVWTEIPLSARRLMLKRWRNSTWEERVIITVAPYIELMDGFSRMSEKDLAAVSCSGHRIRFNPVKMDALCDDEYRFTIAHELAHCVQHFTGGGVQTIENHKRYAERGDYYHLIEQDANDTANFWGFYW